MSFFKKLFKRMPEVYKEKEIKALEEYIDINFGKFDNVFHEIVSPDIHVDIAIIEPNENRDYYTLVTIGMGAHKMNVPKELAKYKLEYAEVMIRLPKDWDIHNEDNKWSWPFVWLKILARLPIQYDTWLGFGHTVPNEKPFAEDTSLNCVMLVQADDAKGEEAVAKLPSGKNVNFYSVIPLYEEEANYKLQNNADALIEKFAQGEMPYPPVVDKNRKNYITEI